MITFTGILLVRKYKPRNREQNTVKKLIISIALSVIWMIQPAVSAERITIGSRLELMIDNYLIERMSGGAELRLHYPTMR